MKKSYKKANLAIPLIIIGVVGVLLFSSPAISEDIPITLWSIHNAISNVNMTNHNITNIQELCDGQECYTLEELNYSILSYNISNLNNLTIGDKIFNGNANRILFENGSNKLSESDDLTYDEVEMVLNGNFETYNVSSHHIVPDSAIYNLGSDGYGGTRWNHIYTNDFYVGQFPNWLSFEAFSPVAFSYWTAIGGRSINFTDLVNFGDDVCIDSRCISDWSEVNQSFSLAIGNDVGSSTANSVLFVNSSNQLSESDGLTYDGQTLQVVTGQLNLATTNNDDLFIQFNSNGQVFGLKQKTFGADSDLVFYNPTGNLINFYNSGGIRFLQAVSINAELDMLGNNIKLSGGYISNDGDNEGISVNANGGVSITGDGTHTEELEITNPGDHTFIIPRSDLNKQCGFKLMGGDGTTGWIVNRQATSHDLRFYSYGIPGTAMLIDYDTGNVGIGTDSPDKKVEIIDTDTQLRLTHTDNVDYADFTVNSDGDLAITPVRQYNPKLVGFAVKNSNTSMSATTWTVANFSTELDDNDNAFSISTYTVPAGQGGIYDISGMFTFASVTNGNRYIVGVEVNGGGSPSATFLLGRGTAGATNLNGVGGNVKYPLNAGDTIRMVVYCDNATSGYNQNGYQTFSAYRIGA